MSNRFFVPEIVGEEVRITGAEANHIARVLRKQIGDELILFDGSGHEFRCQIAEFGSKSLAANVVEKRFVDRELATKVIVASALPKGDRQKFLVEKLTEIGVAKFIPISTQRSIVKPTRQQVEKFRRYVIESSKQCLRNQLMEIGEPASLTSLWEATGSEYKLLLHPGGAEINVWLSDSTTDAQSARMIIVGPEGGFSDDELEEAKLADINIVSLGSTILRIETAAIVAATLVSRL